jgi:hypothetical protein
VWCWSSSGLLPVDRVLSFPSTKIKLGQSDQPGQPVRPQAQCGFGGFGGSNGFSLDRRSRGSIKMSGQVVSSAIAGAQVGQHLGDSGPQEVRRHLAIGACAVTLGPGLNTAHHLSPAFGSGRLQRRLG